MRDRQQNGDLTVHAIAGTYVVLLGMNMLEARCQGLLGFAIHRTDHTENEAYWLEGMKVFKSVPVDIVAGGKVSTRKHPVQGFTWSDYAAKPGHQYTYQVVALGGTPAALVEVVATEVNVTTEAEQIGNGHEAYFNRGTAASQEYAVRFNNQPPDKVGEAAYTWLSRGLHEAMLRFMERAADGTWQIRMAAYEFTEPSILAALKAAKHRGVDVQALYHAREVADYDSAGKITQTGENRQAVTKAGILGICHERLAPPKNAISHNKFIVLLHNGGPVAVLTGSTNFSTGGIFGHSNVAHVVNDPAIAGQYLEYWTRLMTDPVKKDVAPGLDVLCPLPPLPLTADQPPAGTGTVYSPRSGTDALDLYAALGQRAKDALFMTFAFGMHPAFRTVYATGPAPLRYTIMEKMVLPNKDKVKLAADTAAMTSLRRMPENRMAIGGVMPHNILERWTDEKLTGFNVNVKYLHTKYMLVDPLGADPIVVTGSANFSVSSCNANDENMLVIRGDTRVADIYLGEFMRLYKHFAFRDWLTSAVKSGEIKQGTLDKDEPLPIEYLDEGNTWWKDWFGTSGKSRERAYFSR
ncbi:MAG: hypothetical protein JWO94_188 [Verrucomicrobiaceae bacterium]|nr:hypothetical protein [Verrucomicrobiaceae bacterium]